MSEIIVTTKSEIFNIVRDCVFQAMEKFQSSKDQIKPTSLEANPEIRFTIQELAEYWGCHYQTVVNKKLAGELPFHQHGRKVYFIKSEIDALTANPVKLGV